MVMRYAINYEDLSMHVDAPIRFFGNATKAAAAIGVNVSNMTRWKQKRDGIIPADQAVRFVLASKYMLDLGWDDYADTKEAQKQAA
jgi:hypothetical protein